MRLVRLTGFVLTLGLLSSGLARALPWQIGDVITYSQLDWGATPNGTNPASLLVANFNSVYPGGFEVGLPGSSGSSMIIGDAASMLIYLPASGPPGALTNDLVNPSSSPSGLFGGFVVALKLNIDFSDAGLTLGNLGIPFGDLILTNFDTTLPALNGLTLRAVLDVVNTALGGGTPLYPIDFELTSVIGDLDLAFEGGTPSAFAQDHLAVPEPSSWLLLGFGMLGLGWAQRRRR